MGLQVTSRPLLYNYYVSALNWSLVSKSAFGYLGKLGDSPYMCRFLSIKDSFCLYCMQFIQAANVRWLPISRKDLEGSR